MKLKLLTLALLMVIILPLKGQSNLKTNIPEFEFGVSYGLLTPADLAAVRNDLGTLFSFGLFGSSDSHIWGTTTVDFYHKVSNKFAIGAIAGYNSFKIDYYNSLIFNPQEGYVQQLADKYWFVLPAVKYYYGILSDNVNVYSGVAIGVANRTREIFDYYPDEDYSKSDQLRLCFNITVAGAQIYWKHLGVFFELGYGYAGILRAGIRLKR